MPFVSRTRGRAFFVAVLMLVLSLQGCDMAGTEWRPPPLPTPMSATSRQTIEGITARVQTVFADAHRVVLALTLEGPAQPYGYELEITWIYEPQLPGPALTAGGKELPFLPQAGAGMISGAQTAAGLPLLGQGVIAFDASDLSWDQAQVPLHLSLPLLVNNKPFVAPLPVPTGTIPATSTPTQVPPASYAYVLTFDFTFDVAYDSRQVVLEPQQEVESKGVKMTLERIDVTASEARVSIRYSAPKPGMFIDLGDWVSFSTLFVGPEGGENSLMLLGQSDACYSGLESNICVFSYDGTPLIGDAPMDCRLTVTASQPSPKYIGGEGPPPYGTWVFHFAVPAVSTEK